jgi:hypothetical protein
MQYWVLFKGGVGGDGFVNLLEKAKNISYWDTNIPPEFIDTNSEISVEDTSNNPTSHWRIHKRFGEKVKFFPIAPFNHPSPFRTPVSSYEKTVINPDYTTAIENNLNIIVPCHYSFFKIIDDFPWKDIVTKNQILIHLYSMNFRRTVENFFLKNPIVWHGDFEKYVRDAEAVTKENLDRSEYHLHIDFDQALNSWEYLQNSLNSINIDLDKKYWIEYKELINYPNN